MLRHKTLECFTKINFFKSQELINIRGHYGFVKAKMLEQLHFLFLVGFSRLGEQRNIGKVLYLVGQYGEM